MKFSADRSAKDEAVCRTITPAVTIIENEKEVVVEAEMAGLKREDIIIETVGDELVIKAKRMQEEVGKGYRLVHRERPLLDYERSFSLSDEVDREKISASYENGLLRLSIAKAEKLQPKKITVS
jgi:HSP20 family protein